MTIAPDNINQDYYVWNTYRIKKAPTPMPERISEENYGDVPVRISVVHQTNEIFVFTTDINLWGKQCGKKYLCKYNSIMYN